MKNTNTIKSKRFRGHVKKLLSIQLIMEYRTLNNVHDRERFSSRIRRKGVGTIPVVIDNNELEIHMDTIISQLIIGNQYEVILENGTTLDSNLFLGDVYKAYRDDDKILYLITRKKSNLRYYIDLIKGLFI